MSVAPQTAVRRSALLVLGVLLLQLAYLGAFPVRRWLAREAAKVLIAAHPSTEDLTHLYFDLPGFQSLEWEDRGREFRFDGRLYDVVRATTTGTGVEVWCIDDERETRLIDELVHAMGNERRERTIADPLLLDPAMLHDGGQAHLVTCPGFRVQVCSARDHCALDRPAEPDAPPPRG